MLPLVIGILMIPATSYGQHPTFGDLIPQKYLPHHIRPATPIDCDQYFHLADSINQSHYSLSGTNPVPGYLCGNDTITNNYGSIEEGMKELPRGVILARMIIDRNGIPVCCKVYSKDAGDPGKEVANSLSKLTFTPSYVKGMAIPTECRFVYDFQVPTLHHRKIID